jgi:acyl-CoA thioesterase
MKKPAEIIQLMMKKDAFSNWLGLEVLTIEKGSCTISCSIKKLMLNGFSIAHGGIAYSIADTTLAFAANSYGYQSFSIETSISHLRKVLDKDILRATSTEIHRGKKTGVYQVDITNQDEELVAVFKGTVYISKIPW